MTRPSPTHALQVRVEERHACVEERKERSESLNFLVIGFLGSSTQRVRRYHSMSICHLVSVWVELGRLSTRSPGRDQSSIAMGAGCTA